MKSKFLLALGFAGALVAAVGIAVVAGPTPGAGTASSHREAPLISEDPTADNTDLYAFRSPNKPDTVTIISNWIPAEDPAAGPMYWTFSKNARYNIYIDKNGDAMPDTTYTYRFSNGPNVAFLRNTQQSYSVTKTEAGVSRVIGQGLLTPPNNIGPKSLGNVPYQKYRTDQDHLLSDGTLTFAGQRDDPFFGDIGAIFDLVSIRSGTGATGGGKDFFAGYAVHSIALQIPISQLDNGTNHTIGIYSNTERPTPDGSLTQVSRIGNPLINELLIPTDLKDSWNASRPAQDSQFAEFARTPILAALLNKLYPQFGPFQETNRNDLVAVTLTGVPGLNFTGSTQADLLRLNMSIPVTASPNRLGVIGGDLAGYPNGRRLGDDVIDISERVVAGELIGKKVPLGDGVNDDDKPFLSIFPYAADPDSGFANTKGATKPASTAAMAVFIRTNK
ncbi:MAG: DUF4331 domain-containing protein [Actinomycetota bacterium]|nr:DUF4331 domain-containing protein [Actinomycetota bacterium]